MNGSFPRFLKVAVFAPLRSFFDYLYPTHSTDAIAPGCRVMVPFGRSTRIGMVVGAAETSHIDKPKLKAICEVLDLTPIIDPSLLSLAAWAIDYYHCPPGEVYEALLPGELRRGNALRTSEKEFWKITESGKKMLVTGHKLGPRQRETLLRASDGELSRDALGSERVTLNRVIADCTRRGWLYSMRRAVLPDPLVIPYDNFLALNPAQTAAMTHLQGIKTGYRTHLLHGVTGSGKTEIYLHLVRDVVAVGGQALILIPEIGLTEQLVKRFEARFGTLVAVLHSGLGERARAEVWQRCKTQEIRVLLGTRSAVWLPLPELRLIVVDEEHDQSYKQQEGLRYSARDIAVVRAHRVGIPIVLGSATPSLESLLNCDRGKYQYVAIPSRAAGATLPRIQVLDIRGLHVEAGLSEPLQAAIKLRASRGEQSLIFLNRRGFAPVVLCHRCGWIASCPRCDARLVIHKEEQQLRCHHCGTARNLKARFAGHPCGELTTFASVGVGTEQLESAMPILFPGLRAIRIDRDSMTRKGELERAFETINAGDVDILVGTQMIAKGHDFSRVTLVGIVDGDSGLLATDFRAEERFVQLIMQVAGRAGRGINSGEVLIQSHHPHHPAFEYLKRGDYREFADHALRERSAAELPPETTLALLRAEATERPIPLRFLQQLVATLKPLLPAGVTLGGPIPALMERRIGKFRANLLLTSHDRATLSEAITLMLRQIDHCPLARKVRWSLDVDAQEIA